MKWLSLLLLPPMFAAAPQWTQLGPQPTVDNSQLATSGRVTALAVDPRSDNTVYLGASEGGVWKTTNGGTSWTPLTDYEPSLSIGALAVAPANPDIVYAATGEGSFSPGNYYGAGILKSTDAGATWTYFPGPFAGARGPLSPCAGGSFISALASHPSNAQIVLAALRFGSCDNSATAGGTPALDGIYRSTDGGATWTQVLPGAAGTSVLFDPSNANNAYAALSNSDNISDLPAVGVWKSTDGGVSWRRLTGGLATGRQFGRTKLAIAASSPAQLYAMVTDTDGGSLLGLYRTTNGGTSWTSISNPPDFCLSACDQHMAIAVHPTNPNIVYAGGVVVYRTNNAGGQWTLVSDYQVNGTNASVHPDVHAFAFAPSGSRFYMGNDGGALSTVDYTSANAVWNNLNTNLAITQLYSINVNPIDPTVAFAGSQDNSTQKYTGHLAWSARACGDGGNVVMDSLNNVYTTCLISDVILYKSTDGGVNFQPAQTGLPLNYFQTYRAAVQFIIPLVMDPSNTGRLYFATYQLYQTTDKAASWHVISPDLSSGGLNFITSVAVAPSDPNIIYAGTSDGRVQVASTALNSSNPSWSLRNKGLPNRAVKGIAIDAGNSANAWVVFSGFSGFNGDNQGHVFHTTDSGQNWTDVSGNLPNVAVNSIVADPARANTLYIGTDIGVFWTVSGGNAWAQLGMGLPRVAVLALAVHQASPTLWAATYGRSVWQLPLSPALSFGPAFTADGVLNAASYASAALAAPDEYISIFGPQLASGTTIANTVPLPTTLAGSSVTVTDSKGASQPAAMFFVSALQVNCILPSSIAPGPVTLTLTKTDGTSATVTMRSEATAPGLFSANANGTGVAAAFYVRASGGSQQPAQLIYQCASSGTCSATPIDLGPSSDQVVLELFGTGLRHRTSMQAVTATVGGFPATVLFAGAGGGYAGLDQVNVLVPRDLIGKGEVPIVLTVDGKQANSVTVAFK
jgi:uncharacterized protein (TIGR03437 family)